MWVPDGVTIFYVWPNECFICENFDVCVTSVKVSTQETQGSVSFGPDAAQVCVPSQVCLDVYAQIFV